MEDTKNVIDYSILLNEAIHNELELVNDEIQSNLKIEASKQKQECVNQKLAYKCSECDYNTAKKNNLHIHTRKQHDYRPYVCCICKKSCKTKATLSYHENTHLKVKPYQCNTCKTRFCAKGDLVRHTKYKHKQDRPKKCTKCSYSCVEESHMNRHMRIHTGEKPYQCKDCSYACSVQINLKRHQLTHSGVKPFKCDICQSLFTQSGSLKEHRAKHTGDVPINKCSLCPQLLGRKRDVIIHTRRWHFSEHPLPCKICQKTFPDKYQLDRHRKSETNHVNTNKPYVCGLCDYSCFSEFRMEEHTSIHKDTKAWKCNYCNQSFRQKGRLNHHKNRYHNASYKGPNKGPKMYQCPNCSKTFAKAGNFKRHITHHNLEPSIKKERRNKRLKLKKETKVHQKIKKEKYKEMQKLEEHQDEIKQEFIITDLEPGELLDELTEDPLTVR